VSLHYLGKHKINDFVNISIGVIRKHDLSFTDSEVENVYKANVAK